MAAFNFHRRKTRRWWYAGVTLMAAALFAVFFVGGASANLIGSTFGGGDGNLTCSDSGGATDWNCLSTTTGTPLLNIGTEAFTGTQDNSFGQGTKENNSAVTLVQGSIPPNKSDLTRFYEASEVGSNSDVFLYLAWERSNTLGNANMDFEINKTGTACMKSTGPFPVHCTITRTVGDILVTYDFPGSGTPVIGIRVWDGSAWQPDTTTVTSESAVNSASVLDSHLGSNVPANEFGEVAIDLTASGVVSAGDCGFSSATTFLKSRSSSSFTSEIKDYVSPISTPIVPCKGAINVVKQAKDHNCSDAGTGGNGTPDAQCVSAATRALPGASFSIWQDTNSCTGLQTTDNEGSCTDAKDTKVGTSQSTALSGTGATAVASTCFQNLTPGDFFVHEDSAPANSGFATGADQKVTVSAQGQTGDCSAGSGATEADFTDLPLTNLSVSASSVVVGQSNSRITCTSGGTAISGSPAPADDSQGNAQYADPDTLTSNNLKPGTYNCTVVIDP